MKGLSSDKMSVDDKAVNKMAVERCLKMIRCGYTMAVYIDEMAVLIISSFLTSIK
jgi:hypothetical protein